MQQRLQELDLLRALAILAVIVIHAAYWSIPIQSPVLSSPIATIADLARTSVPAFVLASGFALRARYTALSEDRGPFLMRRWRRTLLPWASWAPVFLVVGFDLGSFKGGVSGVASWLAYGAGHLYFLLLIAQLYLVFLALPRSRRKLALAAAVALAVQVTLGWLHTYRPAPGGLLGWPFGQISYWQAPYYAGYFVAGALLADVWPWLRRQAWLLPAALAAVAAAAAVWLWSLGTFRMGTVTSGTNAYLWPGRVPLVLATCLAVLAAGRAVTGAAVRWLGSQSLGVYISHPVFLALAGPTAMALAPGPRALVLGLGALAFGVLAVLLIVRAGPLAMTIGEDWRPRPKLERRRALRVLG